MGKVLCALIVLGILTAVGCAGEAPTVPVPVRATLESSGILASLRGMNTDPCDLLQKLGITVDAETQCGSVRIAFTDVQVIEGDGGHAHIRAAGIVGAPRVATWTGTNCPESAGFGTMMGGATFTVPFIWNGDVEVVPDTPNWQLVRSYYACFEPPVGPPTPVPH